MPAAGKAGIRKQAHPVRFVSAKPGNFRRLVPHNPAGEASEG